MKSIFFVTLFFAIASQQAKCDHVQTTDANQLMFSNLIEMLSGNYKHATLTLANNTVVDLPNFWSNITPVATKGAYVNREHVYFHFIEHLSSGELRHTLLNTWIQNGRVRVRNYKFSRVTNFPVADTVTNQSYFENNIEATGLLLDYHLECDHYFAVNSRATDSFIISYAGCEDTYPDPPYLEAKFDCVGLHITREDGSVFSAKKDRRNLNFPQRYAFHRKASKPCSYH
ncbi:uncharacterized protein LOC131934165 [Physella acuta]|uniref:uncharacterized protein LOC131934165 n=1 Tax=Physella acuta TaxID=109671 RepID=UPI0027DB12D6|nr:uncharacterized protein LOC131934165 [Physella acuta]